MRTASLVVLFGLVAAVRLHGQADAGKHDSIVFLEIDKPPTLRSVGAWYYPVGKVNNKARVVLQALVDTLGRVDSTSIVVISTTDPDFGRAASQTLLTARFRPGKSNGRHVPVVIQVPITYPDKPGHWCVLNPITTMLPPQCY